MSGFTFNKCSTELWDSDTPESERFRKFWREEARSISKKLNGATIELYSYEDVLLDAITY